jgi:hypothetical protein
MTDQDEAYCQCCGQKCHPQAYQRPAEDYDQGTGGVGLVDDWRSPCCHDALSMLPVTDQCCQCGDVAARGQSFPVIPDGIYCPGCLAEMREKRPDMENVISMAEYREER